MNQKMKMKKQFIGNKNMNKYYRFNNKKDREICKDHKAITGYYYKL